MNLKANKIVKPTIPIMKQAKSKIGQYYRNIASPSHLTKNSQKDITVQTQNASHYLKYKISKPLLSQSNVSFSHVKNNSKINSGNSLMKLNTPTALSGNNIVNSMNLSASKNYENNHKINSNHMTNNNDIYTQKVSKLQKEKNNLVLKNNEQKTLIAKLTKDNETLQKELQEANEAKNLIKKKYEKLKENQDQLIMLLKLVEKEGVNLENIITKWNSQMDEEEALKNSTSPCNGTEEEVEKNNENNEEEDNNDVDDVEEDLLLDKINHSEEDIDKANHSVEDLDKINHSDEDLDKDGQLMDGTDFLPLTLGDNNINYNTVKIQKANVPKLDFGGIKLLNDKKIVKDKDKIKKVGKK